MQELVVFTTYLIFLEAFETNYRFELLGRMLEFKIEAFNCSAPCNTSLLDDEELLKEVMKVATTSKFPGKMKASNCTT